jgi:myo-inositol-1(or 4)-monophosphatase
MLGVAQAVGTELDRMRGSYARRRILGDSPGGDAQFDVDALAEGVVWNYLRTHSGEAVAVYTEDHLLRTTGPRARRLLVIDPIDGTRPVSAGLGMGMVSVAAAPMRQDATLDDVDHALLFELGSSRWMYCARSAPGIAAHGYSQPLPVLSANHDLTRMFWSIELNGHPMDLMSAAYGHLVDRSANSGGIFVFNSASFSISRIITGQLDAYVDVGNRLLRDHPGTEAAFRLAGRGSILHLFPYDIAASVLLAKQAGLTISDGYGRPMGGTLLLDPSPQNQQSCIAAANQALHEELIDAIRWDLSATPAVTEKSVL